MNDLTVTVAGQELHITNPDKMLWPEVGITKLAYINYLLAVSDFLLPYTGDRLLMMWRYPDGVHGKRFVQKAIPDFAPEWVSRSTYKDKIWIVLNDLPTLVWVANLASLEIHVPFSLRQRIDYPTELVFDLDPMDTDNFDLVREIALQVKEVLDSLGLLSVPKTSGATGIQIFVPIEPRYTFEQAREINKFIADYIQARMPEKITLERFVKKRGLKLYFDYLQLWKMRTMPAVYSARATPTATISAPVTWQEMEEGFRPTDFTMLNIEDRLRQKGDLFSPLSTSKHKYNQNLDDILSFLKVHV